MGYLDRAREKLEKSYELETGEKTDLNEYIHIRPQSKDECDTVTLKIQNGPTKEVDVNGILPKDMIEFILYAFIELNETFPCRETAITISKLQESLMWQNERIKERKLRGVYGYMKK